MSHRGVEIVLGRLATDVVARRRFREAPRAALRELVAQGIELSPVEIAALESIDPDAVGGFARALDPRLRKAVLVVNDEGRTVNVDETASGDFEA
jgi:hypothetical protein